LKPGSVGRQLAKVELKLVPVDHQNPQAPVDPDQRHDQPDRIGEIMARGPNLMSGYYKDRDATDAVLKDGWLRTGDLGRFDRDGRLYVLGRVKDVIAHSGGDEIYLDELEENYRHSPFLRELAVIALGDRIAALAVPEYRKGKSRRAVEDKLREHFETVSAGLNAHKRIEILRFTDAELPRTRTHKVKRAEVVTLLREAIDSSDAARQATRTEVEPRLPSYACFADPYTFELPPPLRRLSEFAIRKTVGAALDSLLKPRVMGRGNIPANHNFIVVANQASHLDFALVSHALGNSGRDLVVLAAKDYFFDTGLRRFASTNFARLIPFDRDLAQIESLEAALAELAAGRSILMFPEGTRSPDGAIHEFKSGVGYLAMHAGCDVLPIHLKGTFEVLGKGQLLPRRAPVEVRIGRVMTSDELRHLAQDAKGAGAYRKLADHIRKAVIELGEGGLRSNRRASIEAETSPLSEGGSQHEVSDVSRPRNRKSGSPAKG
jgi:long-chain acyl-CoA synthetase